MQKTKGPMISTQMTKEKQVKFSRLLRLAADACIALEGQSFGGGTCALTNKNLTAICQVLVLLWKMEAACHMVQKGRFMKEATKTRPFPLYGLNCGRWAFQQTGRASCCLFQGGVSLFGHKDVLGLLAEKFL